MTAGHPQESKALGGLGREPEEPFTLHVSQTFASQGIVTQASDGLHMPPHPSAVIHASAAPSLVPLALSASRGSAVLCGFGWGSACLRPLGFVSFVPARLPPGSAVLRVSVLCRMVLRLRWPPLALLLLRIHQLALGFLLRLRCLVRCGSLRGPQPVALRSLNVRRSDLPPFLIVFPPGFRLSTPGCMFGLRLYIAVHRLYRLFCPVRGDAVRSPMPRCHGVSVYVLHGEGCGLLLGVTTIALYVSFG